MSPGHGWGQRGGVNHPWLSPTAPDQHSPPSCHPGPQVKFRPCLEQRKGGDAPEVGGPQVCKSQLISTVLLRQIRTISPESKCPAVYPARGRFLSPATARCLELTPRFPLYQTSCRIFQFLLRPEQEVSRRPSLRYTADPISSMGSFLGIESIQEMLSVN